MTPTEPSVWTGLRHLRVPAEDPLLIEDENGFIESLFTEDGNQGFMLNTTIGGSWFTVPPASNGLPDASLKVLVMQLTTSEALCQAKSTTKSSRSA